MFSINPRSVSRYRERYAVSGAKSDASDAKLLADVLRTDRQNYRPTAQNSELATSIQRLVHTHQSLIWARQKQVNQLRNLLREFYPGALLAFGTHLASPGTLAILQRAPTPKEGSRLSTVDLIGLLQRAGRQRAVETMALRIQSALSTRQMTLGTIASAGYRASVEAMLPGIQALTNQLAFIEAELQARFLGHPDASIFLSLPGVSFVLGARLLAGFGDAHAQYRDAKSRKNYAGTSPVTKASGARKAVLKRTACNRQLRTACFLWAFSSLRASPGAHRYYQQLRSRGHSHGRALMGLANRFVGILHGCLGHQCSYSEAIGWGRTNGEG